MTTIHYSSEYRINKKGCECFRTESREAATERVQELQRRNSNCVYSMQERRCRIDNYGAKIREWKDRPQWGPWYDCNSAIDGR
jgi:hypothetical protein